MRPTAAFSLVEVLCAIIVLGVGLAGLTQGLATALNSSKESELQTTASLIAAGIIEQLRAGDEIIDGSTDGECGKGLSLYRWKQKISPADIGGLHEVSVVVEHSKTGKAIYELNTLLFEPPLDSTVDSSKGSKKDSGKNGRNDSSRKKREGRR